MMKSMLEPINRSGACLLLVALTSVWLSGCASTQEAKSVEKSGFLGDYSMLREGQRSTLSESSADQALWIYKNPAAEWSKYKKIQLDPVTLWTSQKDSQLKDVSAADRQRLAGLLWAKLDEALRKDYEIVNEPGPDVLRIQVAITEASESSVALDTVTSIISSSLDASGSPTAS